MTDQRTIAGGVVHELPGDLKDALQRDPEALATWEDITPLARNEAQEDRLGLREFEGWKAPSLLLARMSSSLTFDAARRLC